MSYRSRLALRTFAATALLLASALPSRAQPDQELSIDWQPGPTTVDLGSRAELDVREGHMFADAANSKALLQASGNPPSGQEVGIVTSTDPDSGWFVVFEYDPIGYVKDDEKDEIDADELFESIDAATEQSNEWRRSNGFPEMRLTRWAEKPNYDETTHNLVWALEARDSNGGDSINYNTRILGRRGVMVVTLVTDPNTFPMDRPEVEQVMAGFHYVDGERYADFLPGDKVAAYGLTALVAGGAGAAAVKLGLFAKLGKLLAKAWKLVLIGLAALGAAIKRLFGRKHGTPAPGTEPPGYA